MAIKVCYTCGGEFNDHIYVDGKLRNMQNRRNCLECSPWKSNKSNVDKTIEEKREKRRAKYIRYYNKKKLAGIDVVSVRRKSRKQWLINLIGGKCQICGYDKCSRNLAFHHLNDKLFALTECNLQRDFQYVINEVIKCILVCHNCHGEIHDDMVSSETIYIANIDVTDKIKAIKCFDSWNNPVFTEFRKLMYFTSAEK